MGTVVLYRSAINRKYVESGVISPTNHPTVNAVLKGLARLRGRPARQVKALREYHIRKMLNMCDRINRQPSKRLISLRDAAVIAIGFAGALRRSEICGLTMEDIEFVETDPHLHKKRQSNCEQYSTSDPATKMLVYIRRSKTDQEGKGQKIAILGGRYLKPVQRLQNWLEASGITTGPVFQTMKRGGTLRGRPLHHSDVPRLVKHYARLAGLDSKDVSGHSLRAGFVTSAACHNARLDKIMEITRHTNPSTVMKYIRDADSFSDHAGESFL
ncbi:MAG: site-specific integrase [Candidatus Poribacteria bacterium]|nr:site-specific integrase [Candidatus Poribacteria bacterium]